MKKVAIMGHGTVGSGVYEVFDMNASRIAAALGEEVEVKYVLDLRDFSHLSYADKFVSDFETILNDPEVTIVAEVMGGIHAAYDERIGHARHVFTHLIWEMEVHALIADEMTQIPNGQWVTGEELAALPLPTAVKAARQWAMERLG